MAGDWKSQLVRECITAQCKEAVCQKLSSDAGQGYEMLASRLGFSQEDIDTFKLKNPQLPARAFLETWMYGNGTTIRVLLLHLAMMNRQDIIHVLESHLKDPQCMVVLVIDQWTRTPTVSINKTVREIIRDLCAQDEEIRLYVDPEHLEYLGCVPPEVNGDIWEATAGQIRKQEIKFKRRTLLRSNTTPRSQRQRSKLEPKATSENVTKNLRDALRPKSDEFTSSAEFYPTIRNSDIDSNTQCNPEICDTAHSGDESDTTLEARCVTCRSGQYTSENSSYQKLMTGCCDQSQPTCTSSKHSHHNQNISSKPSNTEPENSSAVLDARGVDSLTDDTKALDLISTCSWEVSDESGSLQECFAPEQLPYFCGDATSDHKIAQYLALYLDRTGRFIVRPSRHTKGHTCISVVFEREIISYKIHHVPQVCGCHVVYKYYLFEEGPQFTDIRELISYYRSHPMVPPNTASATGAQLRKPVNPKSSRE